VCARGGSYQHGFAYVIPRQNGGRKIWRWSPMPVAHRCKRFFKTTGFQVSSLHKVIYLATAIFQTINANSFKSPCDLSSFFQNSFWGFLLPKTRPATTLDAPVGWHSKHIPECNSL
jgi:hypothetical protein